MFSERLPVAMRNCITYNYWHDLKTDIRLPQGRLDFVNMLLRRLRLVLVKTIIEDPETGQDIVEYHIRRWVIFLDMIHEQGLCSACNNGG